MFEEVRRHCAEIAGSARHVRIDLGAADLSPGASGLDPAVHFLEGPPEEVRRFVLTLGAVNFGSGWFGELGLTYELIAGRIAQCFRAGRPVELDVPGELGRLYAEALRQLDAWWPRELPGTAEELAVALCEMPFFRDPGFYKRAQITANDLVLAGVADFGDVDRLTIFADNMVPAVLRADGVLVYDGELAGLVDGGVELAHGCRMEEEIRACALHACERLAERAGVAPRTLDNWLWNRGAAATAVRPHVTRTTAY